MLSCLAAVGCVQGVPEFADKEQLTQLKRAMGSRRSHAKVLQVPALFHMMVCCFRAFGFADTAVLLLTTSCKTCGGDFSKLS